MLLNLSFLLGHNPLDRIGEIQIMVPLGGGLLLLGRGLVLQSLLVVLLLLLRR
jgi:hypothetical protein